MAFDESLDARIGEATGEWGVVRKKMFGGTCYLINGNMLCGVYKDFLILRLGDRSGAEALHKPHVKPFDITGKPMKGWVMVEENGFKDERLLEWLHLAREYVKTLPAK